MTDTGRPDLETDPIATAQALDARDPLAAYRSRFAGIDDGTSDVVAYLDGNSLGRPTRASIDRIHRFVEEGWGGRLIRGWDEEWMELPFTIGDAIGRSVTGAAPGQTFIADSTTVILYKLARAAVDALPQRSE
ncbi:MAG TPA: kynureninase, partial [Leifsonia sp.]